MRLPLLCLFVALLLGSAHAAEPFFKKNDVIALVGGEDMVVASEYGYLELLLTRALPDYHLRFRSLAWEGDTVYEQRRDLNFPTWEEQLDKIGATVVICQFGQMESLAGKEKLPEFVTAYTNLLVRLGGEGKRRLVIVSPNYFSESTSTSPNGTSAKLESENSSKPISERLVLSNEQHANLATYADAIKAFAEAKSPQGNLVSAFVSRGDWDSRRGALFVRDGIHLNALGHATGLGHFVEALAGTPPSKWANSSGAENPFLSVILDAAATVGAESRPPENPLLLAIRAKNKLWFDYWRVQNWAFLFGDRTNQPSSRDWRDPSKRWFPAEREEFIPLIEAKEKEIDALAAKLAGK
ncbi:MAG: hypothetical protein P4L99_19340 [Chthoniobacter sp.]|nr:hypothetical protein [Chthoniobacter sp.]